MKKKEQIIIGEAKVLPHDIDTERAVLASIIMYNQKFQDFSDILIADVFYGEKEKAIYRCIEGVIADGGVTDINSLYGYSISHDVGYELDRLDFVYVIEFANRQTLSQDVARIVDMYKRRVYWIEAQLFCQRVLDMTLDPDVVVNEFYLKLQKIFDKIGASKMEGYGESSGELKEIVDENKDGRKPGLRTGFTLFDDNDLLRPQMMTVIAAFTSVGKSALALNITMAVARQNIPVAYYSLEMSNAELVARSISREMGMPSSAIMNKPMNDEQHKKFKDIMERDRNLPVYFDDRATVSFDKTIRSIRRLAKTKGIKLAVIDYLQIYNQVSDDEEQSMAYMARSAKNIAKEMDIAVIVLSQLNRNGLHPSIKMLRGSGQIEESADNIVLIDRPEAYPDNKVTRYEGAFKDVSIKGTAKLILSKGRGVGTGCQMLAFNGKYTEFSEMVKPDGGKYDEKDDDLPF